MPRYIATTPIKAGPRGDNRITQPGEEIELSLAVAAPLLESGSIRKPRPSSAFSKLFGKEGAAGVTVKPEGEIDA